MYLSIYLYRYTGSLPLGVVEFHTASTGLDVPIAVYQLYVA